MAPSKTDCVEKLLTGQLDEHVEAMLETMDPAELADFGVRRIDDKRSIDEHIDNLRRAYPDGYPT